MMTRARKSGPHAHTKDRLTDHAGAHPTLAAAGAGLLALALAGILLWFLVFSGLNGPVQFVYASF